MIFLRGDGDSGVGGLRKIKSSGRSLIRTGAFLLILVRLYRLVFNYTELLKFIKKCGQICGSSGFINIIVPLKLFILSPVGTSIYSPTIFLRIKSLHEKILFQSVLRKGPKSGHF